MASGELFPATTPAPAALRAGWVCPHCRTAYSPDVQACHCSTVTPSLADRLSGRGFPRTGTCTCNVVWNSILPPPPCPVHGGAQSMQAFC